MEIQNWSTQKITFLELLTSTSTTRKNNKVEGYVQSIYPCGGQLANELSDFLSNTFSENTKNNPKDDYNGVIMDEIIVVKTKEERAEGQKKKCRMELAKLINKIYPRKKLTLV